MATLKITLENGFFSKTNGCYLHLFEPTHVVGNGWDCTISEDGTIVCEAVRYYSDGEHSMRYKISPNGYAKLTLKVHNQRVKTIRKGFVLTRGAKLSDGVIGLAGGNVDKRYAYFRYASFQQFLDRFGITAVMHQNPNTLYTVRNALYGGGRCHSTIISDGKIIKIDYDSGRSRKWAAENLGTCAFESDVTYQVTGATWTIQSQTQHEGDSHNRSRILYTLERDVTVLEKKLMEVPDISKEICRKEQIRKLHTLDNYLVKDIKDMKEVIHKACEIAPNIKSVLNEEMATEFLNEFDLTDGFYYKVEIGGPNCLGEFEVFVVCSNDRVRYGEKLLIAKGPLE